VVFITIVATEVMVII